MMLFPPVGRTRLRRTAATTLACGLVSVGLAAGLGGCGSTGGGKKGADTPHERPAAIDLWPADDGRPGPDRSGCDVLSGPVTPGGEFVVTVTDSVSPRRAPIPYNASERLVFAQLYETLVRVDCAGRLLPGLAEHWACSKDSTSWVFTLRDEARLWDGTRITAQDVLRAWHAGQAAGDGVGSNRLSPWRWLNARSSSVTVRDARRLAIQLPEPQARFPWLLSHPAMAVGVRRDGWTWPVGSGPCRLRASDPAPLPDLICRPNQHHPDQPGWKYLTFRVHPGVDPRDRAADPGDLMIVRDLATVRFYAELPGFRVQPLPWDRLYLLVCPPKTNLGGTARWLSAAARLNVEHDLTNVSARTWPHAVFPAGNVGACPQLSGPVTSDNLARLDWVLAKTPLDDNTLAFAANDPGARELAHRLGALSSADVKAAGLTPEGLSFALQWQMAGAVVLAAQQTFPTACLETAALLGRAAWLQELGLAQPRIPAETLGQADRLPALIHDPAGRLVDGGWVRPLALSHPWLVVRDDLQGLTLDFDGAPRLDGLGHRSGPAGAGADAGSPAP